MQKPRRLSSPPDVPPAEARSTFLSPEAPSLWPASGRGGPHVPDPGCEAGTRVTLPAPRSHAHRLELSPLRSPPKCQEQQTLQEKSLRGGCRGHREERGASAHGSAEPQKEPQAGVPALSHPYPSEKSKSLQAQPRSPTPPPGGLPAPASPAGKRPGRSGPLVSTPNPTPPSPCRLQNSASPRRAGTHTGTLLPCGLPCPRPGPQGPQSQWVHFKTHDFPCREFCC